MQAYNAYVKGDSVILLSREKGRRVSRSVPADFAAFFKADDISPELMRDLKASRAVRAVKRDGDWIRVGFGNDMARRDFCQGRESFVAHLGIKTFEADVKAPMRHVVDHNVSIQHAKRCFLDLETDSRVPFSRKEEMRILSWAVVDEQGHTHVGVLEDDTDKCERKLLAQLWAVLAAYDQVCAWNGDGFDFPVLFARTEDRGVQVNPNEWLWLDHMLLFEKMNKNAAESGDEKQSMRLGDIGQAVVGEGKDITPPEVIEKFGDKSLGALAWQLWEAGGQWRDILVRYMIQDTDLLRKIEKETGYIALFDTVCEACNVFGDTHGLNPTHQMDGFMLRLGIERSMHFPTLEYRETIEKYKGAYVMEPTSNGIARDVHVADFAALYPSIILSWNMSPDTKYALKLDKQIDGHAFCPLTRIQFSTAVKGILPTALTELLRLRKYWNDLKSTFAPGTPEWHNANRKSTAYKVVANSFYGVVGSPFSRFFDRQIAESVTQNGAWLILRTIEEAAKRGWRTIYADTDSLFVMDCSREEFETFTEWCNRELYPRILKEVGCVENHIKLAYEKQFERIAFVSAKRYIGSYVHYKGKAATADSKPEIKGLEFKRGDALVLARKMQEHIIDLICGGLKIATVPVPTMDIQHYHAVITKARSHILDDALPLAEIKLAKSLSKPLKEYAIKLKTNGEEAAQPPHVIIAKILQKRGEDVREGTRVEYIVTDGSVSPMKAIPASDYTGAEADRFYIWENLVYPPTQRLLEAAFPEDDWTVWLKVRPKKERKKKMPKPVPLQE